MGRRLWPGRGVDADQLAPLRLNSWEERTVRAELENAAVVGWVRNLDRKRWALLVPYELGGDPKPLFPDFLFVRRVGEHLDVDILDPHDPNLGDAPAKAHGLAKFAQLHGPAFGRIEVIAEVEGVLHRLDLKDEDIRRRIFAASTPAHLKALFNWRAEPTDGMASALSAPRRPASVAPSPDMRKLGRAELQVNGTR
jgi:type III restriction enzyme